MLYLFSLTLICIFSSLNISRIRKFISHLNSQSTPHFNYAVNKLSILKYSWYSAVNYKSQKQLFSSIISSHSKHNPTSKSYPWYQVTSLPTSHNPYNPISSFKLNHIIAIFWVCNHNKMTAKIQNCIHTTWLSFRESVYIRFFKNCFLPYKLQCNKC